MADAFATWFSLYAALFLRFDGLVPPEYVPAAKTAAIALVVTRLALLSAAQLHLWAFRMAGLADAARLVGAAVAGTALFALAIAPALGCKLPRSIVVLEFFMSTSLMGLARFGPRLLFRVYAEQLRAWSGTVRRTLIVGAGGPGELLARELHRSGGHQHLVVGFVDDAPGMVGKRIDGTPVLGRIEELPALLQRHRVSMVLLAAPDLGATRIRALLDLCSQHKASFKIVPASFGGERASAAMLADLSPEDLLPRDAVKFDDAEIRELVIGRRVLVTGAGGSIGGEIARQLAVHGASTLVLVDMNENELYVKARRLREEHPHVRVQTEVADIRERSRIDRIGMRYRPEYVFHAAAHKHVPLMEEAPEEAVKNNVFGTLNVARMADACGAERFVLISTDKAVNPSSVMGVSKRVAELAVRDLARRSVTRMMAVRFGNVLGSAGSVVPIFKGQIERGGPVTVTHPECTRYFMTIPEAVGLVLLAGLGGYGDLCILDMGEPIKIAELARNLITMAGYVPDEEIAIVYSGLRPGEKLHEELLTEDEERTHVMRDRIMAAESPLPPDDLAQRLAELKRLAEVGDRAGMLRAFHAIVPTYRYTPNKPAEKAAPGAIVPPSASGGTGLRLVH